MLFESKVRNNENINHENKTFKQFTFSDTRALSIRTYSAIFRYDLVTSAFSDQWIIVLSFKEHRAS